MVNFPLCLSPWPVGYSSSGHYVFTQQCPKMPEEEGAVFFAPLDSPLRESKVFSCIPQLTYPYVLLARLTTFAKFQTNHQQGGWNYLDWTYGNLPPWGWGEPQAPLKHMAAWYAIKIERECLLGKHQHCLLHKGNCLEKALIKISFVSCQIGYIFLLALFLCLHPKWSKMESHSSSKANRVSRPVFRALSAISSPCHWGCCCLPFFLSMSSSCPLSSPSPPSCPSSSFFSFSFSFFFFLQPFKAIKKNSYLMACTKKSQVHMAWRL